MQSGIQTLYSESFAIRVNTLTMPWGTVYICLELVLMHSKTAYRLAGPTICAIDETYEAAMLKARQEIESRMQGA